MMGYGVAMPRHRSTGPTPPHATDCPGPCRNGLPQVPGHWEGEPAQGSLYYNGSAVSTLMERTTHLVLLGACPSNRKIPVLGGLFTLDRTEIVNPEPIVCVENFHL
jgi:hypothetical protein